MSYHLALPLPYQEDSKLLLSTPYDFHEGGTDVSTPGYVFSLPFLLPDNLVGHKSSSDCVNLGVPRLEGQEPCSATYFRSCSSRKGGFMLGSGPYHLVLQTFPVGKCSQCWWEIEGGRGCCCRRMLGERLLCSMV